MKGYPFVEAHIVENVFLREFSDSVTTEELEWHQDREDRIVSILESRNWYLQMDNELPVLLEAGKEYYIPAYSFHRVIKGDGCLKIIVEKEEINEYVVPMGFSLKSWKAYRKKHKITNAEYRKKHPDKKWKVVHGHKKGEVGKPLNKKSVNISYNKANRMHSAIAMSKE